VQIHYVTPMGSKRSLAIDETYMCAICKSTSQFTSSSTCITPIVLHYNLPSHHKALSLYKSLCACIILTLVMLLYPTQPQRVALCVSCSTLCLPHAMNVPRYLHTCKHSYTVTYCTPVRQHVLTNQIYVSHACMHINVHHMYDVAC
jgi:hypothetical protein